MQKVVILTLRYECQGMFEALFFNICKGIKILIFFGYRGSLNFKIVDNGFQGLPSTGIELIGSTLFHMDFRRYLNTYF